MDLIGTKKVLSKLLPVSMAVMVMAAVMPAQAAILFQNLGTAAPPATLGGLPMTPFNQLPTAGCYDNYTTIPGCPIPGSMTAAPAIGQTKVGTCWGTWSHGYTGDVYYSNESSTVTLTMPPGTTAFYVYVEPNPFDWYYISAVSNTGTDSGPIPVNGSYGANGFGFYTDGGDTISSITIIGGGPALSKVVPGGSNSGLDRRAPEAEGVDFAIGEFGISNAVTFTNSFYDDLGRSEFCVNFKTGYYQWSILSGQGAGNSYTGVGQVLNGNAKIVSPPGTTPVLNFTFDKLRKKAQGYFIPPPGWYSPLFDKNTADDPAGCTPPRPTSPDLQ
jgi:hypothetical protein